MKNPFNTKRMKQSRRRLFLHRVLWRHAQVKSVSRDGRDMVHCSCDRSGWAYVS